MDYKLACMAIGEIAGVPLHASSMEEAVLSCVRLFDKVNVWFFDDSYSVRPCDDGTDWQITFTKSYVSFCKDHFSAWILVSVNGYLAWVVPPDPDVKDPIEAVAVKHGLTVFQAGAL